VKLREKYALEILNTTGEQDYDREEGKKEKKVKKKRLLR
jgi:hypothetical protein